MDEDHPPAGGVNNPPVPGSPQAESPSPAKASATAGQPPQGNTWERFKRLPKPLVVAILLVLIFIEAVTITYISTGKNLFQLIGGEKGQIACTMEAKICPDGSAVGRSGPNCEFSPCPTIPADPTANWKTYSANGFSFKYPSEWKKEPVFGVTYLKTRYDQYIPTTRIEPNPRKTAVDGKSAIIYETKGSGHPLPTGYSIMEVVIEKDDTSSYIVYFNGDRSVISNELIDQILSTFKFTN